MKRPLFWASLCSIAGTLCTFSQSRVLLVSSIALSLLTGGIILAVRPIPRIAIALPIGFAFGACSCAVYFSAERACAEACFAAPLIECTVMDKKETSFTATPDLKEYRRFRILVYCDEDSPVIGEKILVEGPLEAIAKATNEGEWDALTYYRSNGYIGSAYSWKSTGRTELSFSARIAYARERISEQIELVYPKETAAMVKAVLYCEKSDLDSDVKTRYRRLGIAHILAVSGLHISIFGGFLTSLFLLVMRRSRAETASAAVLFLYGALTGFPVSCTRAIYGFLLSGIGRMFGRTPDKLTCTTVTAALFLVFRPVWILQQGFILSFYCAYVLLYTAHRREESNDDNVSVKRKVLEALVAGVRFSFFLMPVQATMFYTVSPMAPLLNALVLPMMELLLPGAALAVSLSAVWLALGRLTAGVSYFGFLMIDIITKCLDKLSFSVLVTGKPGIINYVLYLVIAVVIVLLGKKKRREVYAVAALAFLCFLPIRNQNMRIFNLNVGQGDCCVIIRGNACVVIDCGSSGKNNVGERILRPFLHYHGFEKPDLVLLSHKDSDHTNGVSDLLRGEWSDVSVALPATERNSNFANGMKAIYLSEGAAVKVPCGLRARELVITVLHPEVTSAEDNANDNSLVVAVSDGVYDALFTGDCGGEVLADIAKRHGDILMSCDYLKIAHHGSVYSAEPSFYEAMRLTVAVVSAGVNNYGHPSGMTIAMAREAGAEVFVTKECGQVTTEFGNGRIKVKTFDFCAE
jgi:DNA internalization-related competence protein ComEC/Rec2